MDEVALKRAIQKGEQTQRLIEAHQDLWTELEADIWRLWQNTKSDQKEVREDLYREHHAITAVQAKLVRAVNEGKKAENELTQQKVKDGDRHRTRSR